MLIKPAGTLTTVIRVGIVRARLALTLGIGRRQLMRRLPLTRRALVRTARGIAVMVTALGPLGLLIVTTERSATLSAADVLAVRACMSLGLLRRLPQQGRGGDVIEGLGGARRLGLTLIPLLVPMRLVLIGVLIMIGAPARILSLILAPAIAIRGERGLAGPPVGGGHRDMLVLSRCPVERLGAGEVASGDVGAAPRIVIGQDPARAVVDSDKVAVIVAVAIVRIANQVGIVGAGAVVIVTIAVGERLHHLGIVVVAMPDPGP
jgi:hypothetical protein